MDWMTGPFRRRLLAALIIVLGGALLTALIMQLPLLGVDWQWCFEAEGSFLAPTVECYDQYPPWTYWILRPWTSLPWRVGLSFQLGMMMMTVAVSTAWGAYRYGEAAVLALVTPPVLFMLWLGQIDGLAMWGLMFLPLGMLWALTKPNIAVWAIFSRWQWVAWAAVVGVVSVAIWGWWPGTLLAARALCPEHPMAIGWASLGWPVLLLGLLLFPFSGPDPLRRMASGALLMPFMMPYHFLMLLPALGRVHSWRRWFLWLLAWTTAVPAVGGLARYFPLSFPVAVWFLVHPSPLRRYWVLARRIGCCRHDEHGSQLR